MVNPLVRFARNVRFLLRRKRGAVQRVDGDILATPMSFAQIVAAARAMQHEAAGNAAEAPTASTQACTECAVLRNEIRAMNGDDRWAYANSFFSWGLVVASLCGLTKFPGLFVLGCVLTVITWIGSIRTIMRVSRETMSCAIVLSVANAFFATIIAGMTTIEYPWHRTVTHPFRAIKRWLAQRKVACSDAGCTVGRLSELERSELFNDSVGMLIGWGAGATIASMWAVSPPLTTTDNVLFVACVAGWLYSAFTGGFTFPFRMVGCIFRRVFHWHRMADVPLVVAEHTDMSEALDALVPRYLRQVIAQERQRYCGEDSPCVVARSRLTVHRDRVTARIVQGEQMVEEERAAGRPVPVVVARAVVDLHTRRDALDASIAKMSAYLTAAHTQFAEVEQLTDRFVQPMAQRAYVLAVREDLSHADAAIADADSVLDAEVEQFCHRVAELRTAFTQCLREAEFQPALAASTLDADDITALEQAADRLRIPDEKQAKKLPTPQLVAH
ncbi:MAG: hypothetical protein Q7S96_01310 [bacterium]|nr:hypothetical protein [bacterium]